MIYHYYLAVIDAFKRDYHGVAYKVLLQSIDEVHNRSVDKCYAEIIPITQSSGTGKSKTVDKVATERILFPLCLRENLGKDSFGA